MKISASFLACKNIFNAVKKISLTDVDYIHVDVVDNNFVKGRKIPLHKLTKIYKYTSKRLDVHLMVKNPKKYIKKFALLNTERIIIHVELTKNVEKYLDYIRSFGIKNGLAINPETDISALKPFLDKIDTILIMSVEPGLGGQGFITTSVDKLNKIKKMVNDSKNNIEVSIDGGINDTNIKELKNADIVVSGSFITNSNNYQEQIDKLRKMK